METGNAPDWLVCLMTVGFFLLVFYLAAVVCYNVGMTFDWLVHRRRK